MRRSSLARVRGSRGLPLPYLRIAPRSLCLTLPAEYEQLTSVLAWRREHFASIPSYNNNRIASCSLGSLAKSLIHADKDLSHHMTLEAAASWDGQDRVKRSHMSDHLDQVTPPLTHCPSELGGFAARLVVYERNYGLAVSLYRPVCRYLHCRETASSRLRSRYAHLASGHSPSFGFGRQEKETASAFSKCGDSCGSSPGLTRRSVAKMPAR